MFRGFNYIKQNADKGAPPYAGLIVNPFQQYVQWNYWDKESYYFLSKTVFDRWYVKTKLFYDVFKNEMDFYTDNTYSKLKFNPTPYDDNTKGASIEAGTRLNQKDTLKFAMHYKLDTHNEGGVRLVTELRCQCMRCKIRHIRLEVNTKKC